MKNSILKKINRLISTAKNGKKTYYEKTESALRLFIENFESELNHNVTPLKSIMDIMGKDTIYLRDYLYKVSTITYIGFSKDKNGNTKFILKAEKDGVKPTEYFGKINWYDKPEKTKQKSNGVPLPLFEERGTAFWFLHFANKVSSARNNKVYK